MSRQLLPRQGSPAPARPAPDTAPQVRVRRPYADEPPPRTRVLRRPAVLALVAVAAVVLAGLGWTLVSSPSDPSGATTTIGLPQPTRPRSATPTPSASATATAQLPGGQRDPFADEAAPVPSAPTTSPHVEPSPTPTQPAGVTTSPTPAPTPGATATPTVTVTAAPPGAATYIGLYGWNGSRASFRVNARTYSVHVGTEFGPGLRFSAVVRGDPPCARVTHSKGSFTLCPGQVTTLP